MQSWLITFQNSNIGSMVFNQKLGQHKRIFIACSTNDSCSFLGRKTIVLSLLVLCTNGAKLLLKPLTTVQKRKGQNFHKIMFKLVRYTKTLILTNKRCLGITRHFCESLQTGQVSLLGPYSVYRYISHKHFLPVQCSTQKLFGCLVSQQIMMTQA